MTIEQLIESGFTLLLWTVSKVRGEKRIVLLLSEGYVASCICRDDVKLSEAVFEVIQ